MIGTFETPTLDLNPSVPSSLDVITAVRTGVASYTDASGLIQEATANTVRVDHSLGYPAMLIEPSATNLFPYSEDFSNSVWLKSGTASVTPNTTVSPDGSLTADTISNATGTSTNDTVYLTMNPIDVDHTLSAYVKSQGATTMSIYLRNGITGTIPYQNINLTDEWQRVTLTHNFQNGQMIFGNSDGDFAVWGAQLEAGSVATSYIPTSGGNEAARTRAADNLTITGSAFSDFYNQSEGTIYVEAIGRGYENFNTVYSINDNTSNNRIYQRTPTTDAFVVRSGNVGQSNQSLADSAINVLSRISGSYKVNNIQYSKDGASATTDTSATIPAGLNKMDIGSSSFDSNFLNGHIKRVIYWPTHSDSL